MGAVLHDLGKRDIASEILNKPGKLTEAEFDVIREHPAAGARALLQMKDVPEVAVIIAYEHHMHLDGTGYPDARGRAPHLCSQIVQLADVYDAMRTHRPYRPAMSLDQTTRIMREGLGLALRRRPAGRFLRPRGGAGPRGVKRGPRARSDGDGVPGVGKLPAPAPPSPHRVDHAVIGQPLNSVAPLRRDSARAGLACQVRPRTHPC